MIALSKILVGDPDRIAIESYVDEFLASKSQLGLGYFLIHVGGRQFGVKDARASVLASSYAGVLRRIANRGKHILSFSDQVGAGEIASAVANELYDRQFTGFSLSPEQMGELEKQMYANEIVWAPDGDAAFDDGSHVLHLDEGGHARIVAFINDETEELTINSVVEVRIPNDDFYEVLSSWSRTFDEEWKINT